LNSPGVTEWERVTRRQGGKVECPVRSGQVGGCGVCKEEKEAQGKEGGWDARLRCGSADAGNEWLEEWVGKAKGMTSTTRHVNSDSVAKAAGGDGNVEGWDKQQQEERTLTADRQTDRQTDSQSGPGE
jgi:hypothetical protein